MLFLLFFIAIFPISSGILFEQRRSISEYQEFYSTKKTDKNGQLNGKFFTDGMLDETPLFQFFVGSQETEYVLSVETGFNKIWLIGQSYSTTKPYQVKYDPKNSTQSRKIDNYGYGHSGIYALYGQTYVDQVKTYFSTPFNQTFGLLQNTEEDTEPELPGDGIIGFSWNTAENKEKLNENSSIVLRYLEEKEKKVFYVWQWRHTDPLFGVVYQSDVDFGYINENKCSPQITYKLSFEPKTIKKLASFLHKNSRTPPLFFANLLFLNVPVKYDDYQTLLSFNINGFTFGKFDIKRKYTAKVDTGLSLIFVPPQIYRNIYKTFNPDYDWERHFLTVDCSVVEKSQDWVFKIEDKNFVLSPKDYILNHYLPGNKCILGVENSADFYIEIGLGNPFLRKYCQIFDVDQGKLGLSEAIHGNQGGTTEYPSTKGVTKHDT